MAKDKGKQKKKKLPLIAVTVGKHREEKKKGAKKGTISQLGREERQMMLTVTGPQEPLDYPTHLLALSDGTFTKEYEIPEEDREKVFRKLYLFDSPPPMDTDMMDIHEGKKFKVRDFRVIREDGGNFIVSPFYPVSGGTLLDWVQCNAVQHDGDVVVTAQRFRQEPPKEEPPMDTNGQKEPPMDTNGHE
ncbi:MAG: hypothetical protein J6T46_07925 [Victivallales bacterium]|nr:hypothetical protein [Victivallales bacterium]